jgi:hypothetical protein
MLADALEVGDIASRDRKLWRLERCSAFPGGLIRALRAELDPDCGDVIIKSLLDDPKVQLPADIASTLAGLVHAAWFRRAVSPLTSLKGGVGPEDIRRFLRADLVRWRDAQVKRLTALEPSVQTLPAGSYGQAVAALALATAWHELGQGARRTSIPDWVKKDYELRTIYYGGLDESLEASIQHAQQLSVKASNLASRHGIRTSPIAKAWLRSAVPEWRYPWVLGKLLLPIPPAFAAETPRERAALRLLSYYAGLLLTEHDLENARVVRGLVANGLALAHRRYWAKHPPSDEIRELLAYARIAVARHTFDAIHFDEAIRLLQTIDARVQGTPELQLLLAVATAARTLSRGVESIWDTTLRVTHWEPLQDFAEHCTVGYLRAFALADQAILRSLNADESTAFEVDRVWRRSLQAAAGNGAEDCIEYQGDLLQFRRRPHKPCTLADPL